MQKTLKSILCLCLIPGAAFAKDTTTVVMSQPSQVQLLNFSPEDNILILVDGKNVNQVKCQATAPLNVRVKAGQPALANQMTDYSSHIQVRNHSEGEDFEFVLQNKELRTANIALSCVSSQEYALNDPFPKVYNVTSTLNKGITWFFVRTTQLGSRVVDSVAKAAYSLGNKVVSYFKGNNNHPQELRNS